MSCSAASPPAAAAAADAQQQQQQQQHPLWAAVLRAYDAAQASGAATRTDTRVVLAPDRGVDFVLRLAAALKAKPKGLSGASDPPRGAGASTAQQAQQQRQPAFNPFLPYEEALWVGHLSDSHTLLLNKFNVVPHHVLVVTREFESQADPLNARDLEATQQVLAAMPRGGVAFYNCGQHSGRSQPHKHVQVVPLPLHDAQQQQQQQHATAAVQPPIQQLVMEAQAAAGAAPLQPFAVRQLPYRAYAAVLTPDTSAQQLEAAAAQLLARCAAGLPSPVSYNVILTRELLLLVPRSRECCGRVAINSLGFAGTILLKSEQDLAFAQQRTPLAMLAEVGQPWGSDPSAAAPAAL